MVVHQSKTVGVLALQGAFARQMEVFESLGVTAVEVRDPEDLQGIDALVIPGGESVTISKMLVRWDLLNPIKSLLSQGLPAFGTCAGLIILSDHLLHWDELPRLGGLNLTTDRNAYGRQIDSFEADLDIEMSSLPDFDGVPFKGVFIRAPQILPDRIGPNVEVLCRFEGLPVLVRQGRILAAAFHPELSGDVRLHQWFLEAFVSGRDGVIGK